MKKTLATLLAGLAMATALPGAAQTWPARPIKVVVPFAAGGTSDILARAIGQKLSEALGQPLIVEARAGANGNVGAEHVAKAPPDGYTLLLTDLSVLSVNPSVYPNMPFDPARDFAPVIMVSYSPHVLGVHPSVPVKTAQELVDFARANPGKLNFAYSGGAPHLAGIEFAQRTGIAWAYIPYKGGSQAVADVAAGQSNVIMNGMLATYPTVKSGRIRALAVSSLQKVAAAPELPTIAELLPGFETGSFQGVVAPAGTPAEVVAKLNAEITRALALPDVKERLAAQGTEVRAGTPQALGAFIAAERTRWAKVIKDSGIKFD